MRGQLGNLNLVPDSTPPSPTTISAKSKPYLLDITQRTPLLSILHSHLLPQGGRLPLSPLGKPELPLRTSGNLDVEEAWDQLAWATRGSQWPLLMTPACQEPSLWKRYNLHPLPALETKRGCDFRSLGNSPGWIMLVRIPGRINI